MRAERPDRVNYGYACESNVPGQQAAPCQVIDYQHSANRDPRHDGDYLPAANVALQLIGNIPPKPGIQAKRRKADAKSAMKAW
jgi:hypothetical protein